MSTETPARRRSLARHPDFRALWAGDAFGQLGAQLAMLAIPVLAVNTLAASAWEMGALTAAESAAFLLIGLPAGAWVDRLRKRRVLIGADLVRATVLAVVVACALTDTLTMPILYAAALVMSCATVFFDVAHQSYVPSSSGSTTSSRGTPSCRPPRPSHRSPDRRSAASSSGSSPRVPSSGSTW
ncbi:hypothetical protein GCM10025864_02940 [Luteimicrobium album]|uniref:MFS transporter n=1 Tax=Luteimicrobium album TaxID=1054550 RepID=A0ABQ6HW14_9MICO|nr:MFS transporter [Luteimicrobium album]GMA22535.1 hypothetical protein GCM10025864_02940 [Luteimicrobium album]